MATKMKHDLNAIAATIHAANETRCACGDHGSWEHSIQGTSGGNPAVWAGCPSCRGGTVGSPLFAAEYKHWQRLSLEQQRDLIANAAIRRVFGDDVELAGYVRQAGVHPDAVKVQWMEKGMTFVRTVRFAAGSVTLAERIEGHK